MSDTKVVVGGSIVGPAWFAGWLYTFGMLHLHVPQVLYAIVIWPYYLGAARGH